MYCVRKSKIYENVFAERDSRDPQGQLLTMILPQYCVQTWIGFRPNPWDGSTKKKDMKKLAKAYAPRIRHLYED